MAEIRIRNLIRIRLTNGVQTSSHICDETVSDKYLQSWEINLGGMWGNYGFGKK